HHLAGPSGNGAPDVGRVGLLALHEDHSVLRQTGERVLQVERVDVIERNELDVLKLGVYADVLLGDGEVVSGRQSFLFRTILRVSLQVHAEDFAGDGGDDLIGSDGAETADRVAAHRE